MSRHYIPPRGSSDGCKVMHSLLINIIPVSCRGIFHVEKRSEPSGRTIQCSGMMRDRIPVRSN